MFPRRYLASGAGWAGYEQTQDEQMQGGLLTVSAPMGEEDSGSNGPVSAEPMEEDKEEGDGEEHWILPRPEAIPLSNPNLLAGPSGKVFWPTQAVPPGFLALPPQILQALPQVDPELLEKHCLAACYRSVLPGALPKSPMLMLLSSAAACAATIKVGRPLSETKVPEHELCISYVQTVLQLHQWKSLVVECVTPFDESIRPRDIYTASRVYDREVETLETNQNDELDALYAQNAPLEDHARVWERHAVEYIHLLERFLYECLLSRIVDAPPLELVLTPHYWPSADECSPELRAQTRADILKFFKFKYDQAPTFGLAPAHLFDQASQGPVWRGWFSYAYLATYHEYLRDSDSAPAASVK